MSKYFENIITKLKFFDDYPQDCYLKTCPPVDGGWAAWSRWSACTHTCGWGSQRRVRSCTRPAAAHGGRECAGDRIQNNKCMLRRCPDTELEAARDLDNGNATISVNDAARSEVIPEPTRTFCTDSTKQNIKDNMCTTTSKTS